jgi:vacuolar iron transporter family protein
MTAPYQYDPSLARTLILDELFDLSLYKALRGIAADEESKATLSELITVETQHLAFWQRFFGQTLDRLDAGRRLKLTIMLLACRLLGTTGIHLVLEAIEVHGVRKYLALWREYQRQPLGEALRGILMDEFKHEEKIRNIFLGLNDGLVEILGAVSGFFGAFGSASMVLIAASTTAVAGALSMGAGAFLALNSEKEVKSTEVAKRIFLGEASESASMEEQPLSSALVVGSAYLAGAVVPVLPVMFGADDPFFSVLTAGFMVIVVSTILSFLSGMDVKRRITLNLVILAIAVSVTYAIGLLAKRLWGISV